MKLIEIKLAKSSPTVLSTVVIKMGHKLSNFKFKTQDCIYKHEGFIL